MGTSTNAYLYYGFDFWDEERGITPVISEESDPYDILNCVTDPAGQVEIGRHCHCDAPILFVAATESITTAYRGYPEEVTSLEIKPEWDEKIRQFCEKHGIPFQQPKWRLASYWG